MATKIDTTNLKNAVQQVVTAGEGIDKNVLGDLAGRYRAQILQCTGELQEAIALLDAGRLVEGHTTMFQGWNHIVECLSRLENERVPTGVTVPRWQVALDPTVQELGRSVATLAEAFDEVAHACTQPTDLFSPGERYWAEEVLVGPDRPRARPYTFNPPKVYQFTLGAE